MGTHLVVGKKKVALWCSTSVWAFGPVFDSEEEAEDFLAFCSGDPRGWDDATLRRVHRAWQLSREDGA